MPALKEVGERVFTVIEHTQLLQSNAYLSWPLKRWGLGDIGEGFSHGVNRNTMHLKQKL